MTPNSQVNDHLVQQLLVEINCRFWTTSVSGFATAANPGHRHKRLLICRRCRYFLIFPLLTYCCPRYIFFAQDGRRKGGVPEAEVVQNRQFIPTVIVQTYTDTVPELDTNGLIRAMLYMPPTKGPTYCMQCRATTATRQRHINITQVHDVGSARHHIGLKLKFHGTVFRVTSS